MATSDEKVSFSDLIDDLREELRQAEKELQLPDGTLVDLRKGTDWQFAVQLGALLETALTRALSAALDDARLDEFIRRLRTQGPTSRLALAKALRLFEPDTLRAIEQFASLRNDFVHDFGMIHATLHDWLQARPNPEHCAKALIARRDGGGRMVPLLLRADGEYLRMLIWMMGMSVLTSITEIKQFATLHGKIRRVWLELGEKYAQLEDDDGIPPGPAPYVPPPAATP